MKLPVRLAAIAKNVGICDTVADVGTDHALIPIYLIRQKVCKKVIATDINYGPLEKAQVNIKKYNLQNMIQLRRGNGLSILEGEKVDCLVISGMGGLLIKKILSEGKDIIKYVGRLVLQPNGAEYELRKSFYDIGLSIVDEQLIRDRSKYYQIIVCHPGNMKKYDFIELDIGPKIIQKKDPLLEDFLVFRISRINQVLNSLENVKDDDSVVKIKYYENLLNSYKEVLKWVAKQAE